MESFHEDMMAFKKQLDKGSIQVAYKGLMDFFMSLRFHFQKKYPEFIVPSNVYFGYMDMTYFSIIPKSFKDKKLKIAIVFNYETFGFEAWLSAVNKNVLTEYWNLIKDKTWDKYRIVKPGKGIDSILEYNLVKNPDFNNLDGLTKQIEKGTINFIKDIEGYLCRIK